MTPEWNFIFESDHSVPFDAWNSVSRRVRFVYKILIHVYRFCYQISLGLNSYVHQSAVSAPKSEDEVG